MAALQTIAIAGLSLPDAWVAIFNLISPLKSRPRHADDLVGVVLARV
jgi:hypothetical protein